MAAGTCIIRIGDLVTGASHWLHGRAGAARSFSVPSVGEQVLVVCPEGDSAAGFVIGSMPSDANPAAGAREKLHVVTAEDGSTMSYDA